MYSTFGEQGFLEERHGKSGLGRPRTEKLSVENKLEKAEAHHRIPNLLKRECLFLSVY